MGQQGGRLGWVGVGDAYKLHIHQIGDEDGGYVHVPEICGSVGDYHYWNRGCGYRLHMEQQAKRGMEDTQLVRGYEFQSLELGSGNLCWALGF